jgi:1-acyl-sn-glycerol-3-phosphate acyltransferase
MPAGKEGIINSGSVKAIIHKRLEGHDAEALCNEARSVIAESLLLHGYGVH